MPTRLCRRGLSGTDIGLEIADGFSDRLLGVDAGGLGPRHERHDLVPERGGVDLLGGQIERVG